MSTLENPSNEAPLHYTEYRASQPMRSAPSAIRTRTRTLALAIVLGATALGVKFSSSNMFSTELKSPEQVSREYDDDLHQRIQAGDEATIDSLGALDYRGFEGREDMIAQVMTEMVNQKEILPGTGPVTDDLMIKMKSALLKDEARLLMTWIFYVRKAEACCKQEENFTTNSHGQRVPKYFEGLSLQEQCRFMKEAMHETGVMELFQEIVQQNSEEVAATTTPLQAE